MVRMEFGVVNMPEVEAAINAAPAKAYPAIVRAVNRATEFGKNRLLDDLTSILTLKRADIAGKNHRFGGVKMQRATNTGNISTIAARVTVTGKRIPIYRFDAKTVGLAARETKDGGVKVRYQVKSAKFATAYAQRNSGLGVQYQIRRAGGRKYVRSAFIAKMKSGHVGVFKRMHSKRLPIQELFGPSIPNVAERDVKLRNALKVDISAKLNERLRHELGRVFKGSA